MGLARDIVEVEGSLREQRADLDVFSIDANALLSVPACAALSERVKFRTPVEMLRTCFQALRIQHSELMPKLVDAELVATLPPYFPLQVRATKFVVREMLAHAKKEIVVLGYELTDSGLLSSLAEAASRDVTVIVICDRTRGVAQRVREGIGSNANRVRIFHDKERPDAAPYTKMHAKCVLVDEKDVLVTSANMTFHGLEVTHWDTHQFRAR